MAVARILIVDEAAATRQRIARTLSEAGYESARAGSLEEARGAMREQSFDLALCDLGMPGEAGLALVEEIGAAPGGTAVLVITAVDSPELAHKTVVLGANGYLVKPFSANELLINVDYALHDGRRREQSAELEREQQRRVREVRDPMLRLEREARAADKQAAELLQPLSEAVGRRDLETGAHIRRVGETSALLAEARGMPPHEVEAIRLAAPMHDVGKVAIPDSILRKRGRLDPDERELVERHAEIGHSILSGSSSKLLKLAAEIALTHHERVDGGGYPSGVGGDQIPIAGRIVAIADVFDALTSNRPYRAALPVEEAVKLMVAGRGSHFDPRLLGLFLDRFDGVRAIADEFADREKV